MTDIAKIILYEALLCGTALLGDSLLQHSFSKQHFVVAVGDSLTHGIIGALSWAVVCNLKFRRQEVFECILCGALAMSVDVDHFLAAKSLSLKAALSLPHRPPFHATTVILLVDIVLLCVSAVTTSSQIIVLTGIFSTAWFSHHVRDGHRRGLWFYPFGETAALPRWLYLCIIMIFPLVLQFILQNYLKNRLKERVVMLETADLV